MKTVKKQVLQKKTFYVAKDGKEFETSHECRRHEWNLAESDARSRFEFAWRGSYDDTFTAVYHAGMKDAFAEDLSTIINSRWDVEHTNMDGDYDPDTILATFEKELGGKLVDGHKYSFEGYQSYTDDDHADDFNMEITDMTESEHLHDSTQECREVLCENQAARDFIEIAKRQVNDFGSAAVRAALGTLIEEICGK
ncbi:MAG: hypothetical protein IKA48_00380 [Fibrobacter sp.]|nr:hypothetical protein [Fibrobacter sp.]